MKEITTILVYDFKYEAFMCLLKDKSKELYDYLLNEVMVPVEKLLDMKMIKNV